MTRSDNVAWFDWPLDPGQQGREVWYGLVTHRERPVALWIRYTLVATAGGMEPRLWAAVTDGECPDRSRFETVRTTPEGTTTAVEPFRLDFGDRGMLRDDAARGTVADIEWDLTYDPDSVTFTPLRSRRITDLAARVLGTGHHWSVNQSVRMSGRLRVGDRTVEFTDAPGHQGHTVGRSVPDEWRWVHCNGFAADGLVVEALDLGGKVSICLRRDGQTHRLNRVHHVVGPRGNRTTDAAPGRWSFEGRGDGAEVRVTVTADEDHWQRAAYPCPDGSRRYNAHCSLSRVELAYRIENGGWSAWETATSDRGRAEWASTEPPVPGEYRPRE